jgi:lipopolysaccharide assembly protein A
MTAPQGAPPLPPPSANGATGPQSVPQSEPKTEPQASRPLPRAASRGHLHTRISGIRTALISGFAVLVVVVIFVIQNANAVNISFLGAHLRVSLAVALLLAVIAGALIMTAAGTARIAQLRQVMRRDRRKAPPA